MAFAISLEDARKAQTRSAGEHKLDGTLSHTYIGSRDKPDLPHAKLTQFDPGIVSSSHFHRNDQFQVVVRGKGTLGRHNLSCYSVHFTRAYTPYGPLIADPQTGVTFFVMRTRYDPGGQHLPDQMPQLKQVPNRAPWGIARDASFVSASPSVADGGIVLRQIRDIEDEYGLAAYSLMMKPNARAYAPDPSRGNGQYLIVTKGALLNKDRIYGDWSMIFIRPDEPAFEVQAGHEGLEALVLNFPQVRTGSARPATQHDASNGAKKWQCALCSFAYDDAKGMPSEGIGPGTRWEDVPETWTCPDCGAAKSDFRLLEP